LEGRNVVVGEENYCSPGGKRRSHHYIDEVLDKILRLHPDGGQLSLFFFWDLFRVRGVYCLLKTTVTRQQGASFRGLTGESRTKNRMPHYRGAGQAHRVRHNQNVKVSRRHYNSSPCSPRTGELDLYALTEFCLRFCSGGFQGSVMRRAIGNHHGAGAGFSIDTQKSVPGKPSFQ